MAWNLSLEGKAGIITGAASGIGRAVAHKVTEMGGKAIIADLNAEGLAETAAEIQKAGMEAPIAHAADCADQAAIKAIFDQAEQEFGGVDFLVNSAGILGRRGSLLDVHPENDWDKIMGINLKGPFLFCQMAIPQMLKKGGGSIVNVASLAGRTCSLLGGPGYTTSKHALVGFSRHIAREFACKGIRVNAFCPGATMTPMVANVTEADEQARVAANIPRGQLGTPEEQAAVIGFMLSDAAINITGACIDSNGGNLMI